MKRITTITSGLLLLSAIAFTPEVQAQRFLRGLAEKAMENVKEKLEPKTDNNNESGYQTNEYQTDEDGYIRNVSPWHIGEYFSIENANRLEETDDDGNNVLKIKKPNVCFKTLKEIIVAIPSLPTVRQILDEDVTTTDKLINFDLAWRDYSNRSQQAIIESSTKVAEIAMANGRHAGVINSRSSAKAMPASQSLGEKIMEAIINSGADMENISEEEAMKIATKVLSQEYKIPESEMAKMIKMAQTNPDAATAYMKKNYPEAAKKLQIIEQENKQMQDEIKNSSDIIEMHDLFQEIIAYRNEESYQKAASKALYLESELTAYANELLSEWSKSAECAKIEAMEADLNKRVDEYLRAHNQTYNEQYPEFWERDRKAQNAIINKYNEMMVEKWRTKMQEYMDYLMPFAQRDAEYEAKAKKLDKKEKSNDADYLQIRNTVMSLTGSTFTILFNIPTYSMDSPRITNVSEDRYSNAM